MKKKKGASGKRRAADALVALQESRDRYEDSEKGKARKKRYAENHRDEINKYQRDRRKRIRAEKLKAAKKAAALRRARF